MSALIIRHNLFRVNTFFAFSVLTRNSFFGILLTMGKTQESEDANLLTVTEAAELAGVSQAAIRNAIYREKLAAKQIYGRLLIDRQEFERYRQETKMGRPRKQEHQQ